VSDGGRLGLTGPVAAHLARLVSGGQTGADRAALDVAVALGLEYGGWCPRGGWAEDHPARPGLLATYPLLRETDSADPATRTRLNVRDSDATLVIPGNEGASGGTALALAVADELGRPVLTADDLGAVLSWLARLPGAAITLNVAGPRESEDPGVYRRTRRLLELVLDGR